MSREVILMADVNGLGAEGDVVSVADGYARNYLLPKKLAAAVTEATRRQLEKKRQERQEEEGKELEAAQSVAKVIESSSCTISVKAGAEGKMFGSVTASDIAAALAEQGIDIDRHKLQLEEPLRELGVFNVPIKLHPQVESSVKVWVVEE